MSLYTPIDVTSLGAVKRLLRGPFRVHSVLLRLQG